MIRIFQPGIDALRNDRGVAEELRKVANAKASRVQAPSRMTISTRAGIGPQGAFSQVMMHGAGAGAVEFGTRSRAPLAPLRRAVFG